MGITFKSRSLQTLAMQAVLTPDDRKSLAELGLGSFESTVVDIARDFILQIGGDLAHTAGTENAAEYVDTLFSKNKFRDVLRLEEKGSIQRLKSGALSFNHRLLALVDFPIDRADDPDVLDGLLHCQTFASFEAIDEGRGSGYISENYAETEITFNNQLVAPGAELAFVTDEKGRFIKYLLYYTGRENEYFEADKEQMLAVKEYLKDNLKKEHIQLGFVSALNGLKAEEDPTITKSEEILSVALLFRHAALELEEKGCNFVALTVRKDNKAAREIYEGLGFISIPELSYEKDFKTEGGESVHCEWDVMYSPLNTENVDSVVDVLDRRIDLLRKRLDITTVIADFDEPKHIEIEDPEKLLLKT